MALHKWARPLFMDVQSCLTCGVRVTGMDQICNSSESEEILKAECTPDENSAKLARQEIYAQESAIIALQSQGDN